jgi:hypothetical protein
LSPPVPKKDPRYRPYRAAAYGLYLVVVCTFSMLVIVSVVRSVRAMSPGQPQVRGESLPSAQCLARAQTLWSDLEAERRTFSEAKDGRTLVEGWQTFRLEWLRRLREDQARCAVDAPQRKALRKVFDSLERIGELYTTSATQYAGEIAPAVKRFHEAVAQAR